MPRTKESGIVKSYYELRPDQQVAYRLGRESIKAELDALRAFVERISWLDPQRGPVHVHAMVEDARRLLERPS